MRSKHSVDNSFQKKWFHFTFTIGVTERCADAHSVSFWELLMVRAHVEFLFDVSILCDCLVYLHLFTILISSRSDNYLMPYEDVEKQCLQIPPDDLALQILLALLKEPNGTQTFCVNAKKLGSSYTAQDLCQVLANVFREMPVEDTTDELWNQHAKTLEQISRQGASRFQGVSVTLEKCGVIEPHLGNPASTRKECRPLGLQQKLMRLKAGDKDLAAFLRACREQSKLVPKLEKTRCIASLLAFCAAAKTFLEALHEASPTIVPNPADGYCRQWILRKLVIIRLCHMRQSGAHAEIKWEECSLASLQAISADASDILGKLPADMSAADVSNLFCCRPDRPLLASMYVCLWKDVSDDCPARQIPVLLKEVQCRSLDTFITGFRLQWGISPHPYNCVSSIMPGGATRWLQPSAHSPMRAREPSTKKARSAK